MNNNTIEITNPHYNPSADNSSNPYLVGSFLLGVLILIAVSLNLLLD